MSKVLSSNVIRAGVIGAGVFGAHHAAHWERRDDIAFVGVFDTHPERAAALAARHGAKVFDDQAALLSAIDVVSICSPASAHGDGASAALRAGVAAYVEKPIAVDLNSADEIIGEARRRGLVAACGFLERISARALGLFDLPRPPLLLEARRYGPPSPRNRDVSVVLDLMIHDLDMALVLANNPPFAVEAEGKHGADGGLDTVEAEVTFENGFIARLWAGRAAATRERCWRLIYPSGEIAVDLLARTARNTTPFALTGDFEDTAGGADALGASLTAFIAAVRGAATGPIADAVDGARALDLALAVERAVGG